MTTKILVPIDFHVESLNTLKLAMNHIQADKVDVVLMYAQDLGSSITELLFYNSSKIVDSLISTEFEEALSILKNRYESRINSIHYEIFHGYRVKLLEDFMESKKIDFIFLPKSYNLQLNKRGIDLIPLIKKSNLAYKELSWEESVNKSKELQLDSLFSY